MLEYLLLSSNRSALGLPQVQLYPDERRDPQQVEVQKVRIRADVYIHIPTCM